MEDRELAEVCPEDAEECVLSYPPCPSFIVSPADISRFKFVADDIVTQMRSSSQKTLDKDIVTAIDRSTDVALITSAITSTLLNEFENGFYHEQQRAQQYGYRPWDAKTLHPRTVSKYRIAWRSTTLRTAPSPHTIAWYQLSVTEAKKNNHNWKDTITKRKKPQGRIELPTFRLLIECSTD